MSMNKQTQFYTLVLVLVTSFALSTCRSTGKQSGNQSDLTSLAVELLGIFSELCMNNSQSIYSICKHLQRREYEYIVNIVTIKDVGSSKRLR